VKDTASGAPPLRLALFSGNYNNVVDGPAKTLNRLVGYLQDCGHDVLVFAPTTRTPALDPTGTLVSVPSMPIPGRGEYRLAGGLNRRVGQVFNGGGTFFDGRIRDVLDRFKPDLVHLSAPDWLGFQALRYAEQRQVPAVASFHTRFETYFRYYGLGFLEPVAKSAMRGFYNRCTHVYVPSPSMAEALAADRIGRDIRLWTRGVDATLFEPSRRDPALRAALGFANDDIIVLFVGRIVLEKGLCDFADAFAAARKKVPALRAMVIGDGPERARFEKMLPRDSAFLGYQDGAQLARGYASADIFFNPSTTETFGNVTLEAMAAGLPVVCARASGSASLVCHGVNGFLAAPCADSLTPHLVTLAQDRCLRARLAASSRQRSLDYDWDAIMGGLVENYYTALGAPATV